MLRLLRGEQERVSRLQLMRFAVDDDAAFAFDDQMKVEMRELFRPPETEVVRVVTNEADRFRKTRELINADARQRDILEHAIPPTMTIL